MNITLAPAKEMRYSAGHEKPKSQVLIIEEVTTEKQIEALHDEWEGLLAKDGRRSPFLTHDWFECCFAGYADGKGKCLLVVRDGAVAVGIASLWRYPDMARGIPLRRIGLVAIPDTPFVDFIVQEERRKEVLSAILRYLCTEKKKSWDLLTFSHWPSHSPNLCAMEEILTEQRTKFFRYVCSRTPYIPIQGDWESFLRSQSVKFRKTRRSIINRIGKLPNVEVQRVCRDTAGNAYKDLLTVSERSWKHSKGIAISSREESRRFFFVLTERAGRGGWLLLWLLKADGKPIAMEYDLCHQGKVYALRADYDEAYKEYSPGAYLEYQIVKHLFEEGYLEYNTGPGLNAYKLHWTDQSRENVVMHVCNRNLKGWLVSEVEQMAPVLKKLKNAARRFTLLKWKA